MEIEFQSPAPHIIVGSRDEPASPPLPLAPPAAYVPVVDSAEAAIQHPNYIKKGVPYYSARDRYPGPDAWAYPGASISSGSSTSTIALLFGKAQRYTHEQIQ